MGKKNKFSKANKKIKPTAKEREEKSTDLVSVNWFPGHMKKTSDLIKNLAGRVEAVIEILDSRIPHSGRNPLVFELTSQLPRLIILNKSDLADFKCTFEWEEYFRKQGFAVLSLNSVRESSNKSGTKICEWVAGEIRKLLKTPNTFTAMVCGIPNVGKSTFINMITGGRKTKVGNRPGITMDKQIIKIDGGKPWALVDMPGLLMTKLNSRESLHLSLCATIKDGIYDEVELACQFLKLFLFNDRSKSRTKKLINNFGLSFSDDSLHEKECKEELFWLEKIAKRRGCLMKGQEIDYVAAAMILIRDFRNGKLGRITLETVDESFTDNKRELE